MQLSREIIARIRRIELRASARATELLSGEYSSKFRGRGMEFEEVREYVPGDDIRAIDWNVTARMSRPFIKIFREEREMTIMLMVDVSPSQDFGLTGRSKLETTAEFAAVLAFLAMRNNDKVGMVSFAGEVIRYIPPQKGRGHVWRIIREVLTHAKAGRSTNISAAADFVGKVLKRRSNVFLISDLIAEDYRKSLSQLDRRHDLTVISVNDATEAMMPDLGVIAVLDSESESAAMIRGKGAGMQDGGRVRKLFLNDINAPLRGLRAGRMHLWTDEDIVLPLERFLRRGSGVNR
jgi:uncharacterized protein (DUF58 family)